MKQFLIVVDMQKDFVDGALGTKEAVAIVPKVAEKIRSFNAVIWSFHGVFASGDSIASAFGLAHAIEKAAEIKLKVLSTGLNVINSITPEQQQLTAKTYGFELNKFE